MLMTWSDALSVHVNHIDSQHMKLISLLNDLNEAMKSGTGNEALERILRELVTYTRTHFAFEEKLMQQHRYGDYPAHKKEHDKLTAEVQDLQDKFLGGKTMITLKVMQFLKDWLSNHILKIDKRFGAFLNGINIT